VKIGDFGIAMVEHESRTQAGVLKGKYGYMSPEQVAGVKMDHRSDLFSAGTVLTELLLGRRLFLGRNDFETLDKVLNVRLDVLKDNSDALPAEVIAILNRALQREPHERFQSARDFHDAIMELLYSQGKRITNETLAAFMAQHVVPYLRRPNLSDVSLSGLYPKAKAKGAPVVEPPVMPDMKQASDDGEPQAMEPEPGAAEELPPKTDSQPAAEPEYQEESEPSFEAALTAPVKALDLDPQDIVSEEGASLDMLDTGELDLESDPGIDTGSQSIAGSRRPSVLVHQVLTDADRPSSDKLPDFRGKLSTRSVAKVLFRFFVVSESGLLTMTGPHAGGQRGELVHWIHKERTERGWEGPAPRRADQHTCELHFSNGKPNLASADRTEEEVVAFLVQTGVVTRDQVAEAIEEKPKRHLIPALVVLEHLGPLQVSRHITEYVLNSVVDTFSWHDGSFAFYRDRSCSSEAFPIGQGGMQLILRGVEAMGEELLDGYLKGLTSKRVAPNRTPPMWIGAFKPDAAMSAVYRAAGESPTVGELVSRCVRDGDSLRVKQSLYLLIECDMVLLGS